MNTHRLFPSGPRKGKAAMGKEGGKELQPSQILEATKAPGSALKLLNMEALLVLASKADQTCANCDQTSLSSFLS